MGNETFLWDFQSSLVKSKLKSFTWVTEKIPLSSDCSWKTATGQIYGPMKTGNFTDVPVLKPGDWVYNEEEIQGTNKKQIIIEIHVAKSRLKNIMQCKTKGVIPRSRVRWHEHGERNTGYFYSLKKRNFEKRQSLNRNFPMVVYYWPIWNLARTNALLQSTLHVNNHEFSVRNNDLPLIF